MKKVDYIEFAKFYEEEIEHKISKLKKELTNYTKKKMLIFNFLTILFLITIVVIFSSFQFSILSFIIITAIYSAVLASLNKKMLLNDNFFEKYNKEVMDKIIRFIDNDFRYNSYGISLYDFNNLDFFSDNMENFESNHSIIGKIGSININISDVSAKNGNKYLFNGIIVTLDFNKNFNSISLILPSNNLNSVSKDRIVKLENKEFNSKFKVYSNNQIESRYILTPLFMEKILKLSKEKNANYFSFVDSKLHIVISDIKIHFSVLKNETEAIYEYLNNIIDKEDSFDYYNKIIELAEIVDELDLNTRIWTKE